MRIWPRSLKSSERKFILLKSIDVLIESNIHSGADIKYFGPVPIEKIGKAEALLGVDFPPSYTQFVQKYGAIEIDGRSFAGITSGRLGDDGNVVAFTLYARDSYGLPARYVAIDFQDGDAFLCIDTKEKDKHGESPIVLISPTSGRQLGYPAAVSFIEYMIKYLSS